MNNDRRGAWDFPLPEYNKQLTAIVVLIHDLQKEDDSIEKVFELNYSSYEDRKFLGRITFWAVTSGRAVETLSKSEWDKMNKG